MHLKNSEHRLKTLIVKGICKFGGLPLGKLLSRRIPKILMYHRFAAKSTARKVGQPEFRNQMKILKKNFTPLSLRQLCELLRNNKQIPENTVVVTIDDGYADFYDFALPVIKEFSIPATLFVTVDFINNSKWLWPDVIRYTLENTSQNNFVFHREKHTPANYDLRNYKGKMKAWNDITDYYLTLTEDEKNNQLKIFSQVMKVQLPDSPVPEYSSLSWKQLRECRDNGVEIGSHTCTHPILTNVHNNEQLLYEVNQSKHGIENNLNQEITSFCYPQGRAVDFNAHIKNLVKQAGYKCAVAGYNTKDVCDDLYEIKRYPMNSKIMRLKKIVYGLEYLSLKTKSFFE